MIVDEAERGINYDNRILTTFPSNEEFQLFIYILSNLKTLCVNEISRGHNCHLELSAVYTRSLVYQQYRVFKVALLQPDCPSFSLTWI